jgi:UDP-N-acetylmuramoyl-tripeptide--D-alanyl-D-alanine ligase
MNALAATAAAIALEIPVEDIAAGLAAVRSLPGRLEAHPTEAGWTLIDDTYNANPASLYAGLKVISESGREAWLVLGDMAELGDESEKLHAEIGQSAADLGVKRLFAVGRDSQAAVLAFG